MLKIKEIKYAQAPESTQHVQLKSQYDLFIGGNFVKPLSKKYFDTINPANEKVIAKVAQANAKDVDKAVVSANIAYTKYWKKTSVAEKGKYIYRIARMIQEKARELAVIESMNGGKAIRESRDFDIPQAAHHFFYYAGWADKINYAFPQKNMQAIGTVGQIIPWNFPLLMAAWKIAPALACGNTVVLKSAETSPLTALKLAEIIQEADLPPGVVNIISGFGDTGAALVKNKNVQKIAFTGSTAVGKWIQENLAGSGKKLSLELGGKGAFIVLDDAAIDQAVEGVINAIFFNQGHVCCAGSRLFLQENIADTFLQKLKRRMNSLIVGDPLDKNTDVGAIHSRKQLEKIQQYIQIGKKEGGDIFQTKNDIPPKGFYCKPTLFLNTSQSHRIVQEEIFGPVLAVQTFRTIEEVIEKANNIPYGLSAGVWTEKGSRIFNLSQKLKAGVVWANTFNKFDPASPFGGFKESGFGREGGMHGLKEYLQ